MSDPVLNFIEQQTSARQRRVLAYLHEVLADQMGLEARIRYRIPFYYRHSWICYLNPVQNEGVELAFTRGNELSNAQGLLRSAGRKQVYGIVLCDPADVSGDALLEVLNEALLLDETVPYASKRK
jgi:hypothetical protein